jgi:hypothetical protein
MKPTRQTEPPDNLIRQRAYSLWLECGCPHGGDWEHWFAAKQQILAETQAATAKAQLTPEGASAPFSIRHTLDAHQSDPTHRFHALAKAHDDRLDVVAGEARQRVRGRRYSGSPRTLSKKPE